MEINDNNSIVEDKSGPSNESNPLDDAVGKLLQGKKKFWKKKIRGFFF